jgi:hypothetical protein
VKNLNIVECRAVSRQRLGKHFTATKDTNATIEELKGSTVQKGLEPGSRGIVYVKSRYQATTSEDSTGWKN